MVRAGLGGPNLGGLGLGPLGLGRTGADSVADPRQEVGLIWGDKRGSLRQTVNPSFHHAIFPVQSSTLSPDCLHRCATFFYESP